MTPEQTLMEKVKNVYGTWIDAAVAGTPYPAAFLAALSANESGGDPNVSRFEAAVFGELAFTLIGRRTNFGAIAAADLATYVDSEELGTAVQSLVSLATSWGPTQIMGYQALAGKYPLGDLPNLQKHFQHTIEMLDDFRRRFGIPIARNIEESSLYQNVPFNAEPFLRCWNTGRQDGTTADPKYVANGFNRLLIYEALA
jgi:hypothetical protein